MQAQRGRTKSALLIWTKSDLSDKVFNKYFTIWPRFGTGYFRFGQIYPDLVIRVTARRPAQRPAIVDFVAVRRRRRCSAYMSLA